MRLHFSIGCYNRRWISRCRHGFQFSGIQILFADHVHRRSGVYNKVSFLWYKGWWAGTNFPRVRRLLFYFSPIILNIFGQLPRCFTGTPLLPFRLFLRPILKFCWANHSKRWILVSNVSMTYHGFSESNTSDWHQYVWALPQDRWTLRRLHILRYATQLSCTWWVSVQSRSPCSLMLLIPFQHSHCTFVTILFGPFARLFFNLAMRMRAFFP